MIAMLWDYVREAFEPSLVFSVLCALAGIFVASIYSKVSIFTAVLLIIGSLLAQMSVNVIDDYVDFRRGIDANSTKTKFSGGTNLLVDGTLEPRKVLWEGLTIFLIAAAIGVYFIVNNPIILPLVAIGAVSVLLYASHLIKAPFLAEPLVVLNFMLIGIGSFIIAGSSSANILAALLVTFPIGAAIGMALLMNEIPDKEADKAGGRKSGVVLLKSNSSTSYYYLGWQIAAYAAIIYGILFGFLPKLDAVVIVLIPLVAVNFLAIRKYTKPEKFERYMGMNTLYSILLSCALILGCVLVGL